MIIVCLETGEVEVQRCFGKFRDTPASILLTNRRLVFEHSSGLLTKQSYCLLSLPLLSIQDVNVERGFFKGRLVIIARGEGYSGLPRIETEVDSPDQWRMSVLAQITARHAAIEEEKRRSRIQYVLDFSFLKTEMERGGVVLSSFKCPNCGASVELPPGGTSCTCAYCKSVIQAQDIFEKIKGLLR